MFVKDKKSIDLFEIGEALKNALEIAKDGVEVIFESKKAKRTNRQNSYYWIVCSSIKDTLNDAGVKNKQIKYQGEIFSTEWTSENIHEINKTIFGVKTTRKLERKEFGEYMEKVFALWLEKTKGSWEVPIPMTSYFNDYV